MEGSMRRTFLAAAAVATMVATAGAARAADCDVTVGVVMELTGPAGPYGQAGAKSIEMAFRDNNDAGGFGRGCKLVTDTPYNEKQSSYQAEVTAAMAGSPDGLYLVSYPIDGATIARAWISQGGPAKFLLNDGMNDKGFVENVGAKYLNDAYGTSSGTEDTASTKYFNDNYKTFSGLDPGSPAAVQAYDAGAIVGLAVAIAGKG